MNSSTDFFGISWIFHYLEVFLVGALPRIVEGEGDPHPPVEEDELEEEEYGENSVLELS